MTSPSGSRAGRSPRARTFSSTTRSTRTTSTGAGVPAGATRAPRMQPPSHAPPESASSRCSTTIRCAQIVSLRHSTTRWPRRCRTARSRRSSRARGSRSPLAPSHRRRKITEMTSTDSDVSDRAADLISFVPRLTIEWLRSSPDQRWLEVDGTLAFVDISGFTAMSEQLSSLGRAGAEEVTDVMNATFSALLDDAYGLGGGLLKFGGDALLLLYQGDGHAERAARAAFEMRRTLRAIGRPRTSAGPVQLRMHAGLHTGRFQFFLVGESHRELLVTGPAATRTVEMEGASEAGEILVSPETAAQLDPSTLGDEKGPGRLLQAGPDVGGALEPLPDVDGVPIELAVPAPLRAQLLEVG